MNGTEAEIDQNEVKENIFNPYNPLNQEIKIENIKQILKLYGVNYEIDNISLYQRAFVHKSYTKRPSIENQNSDIQIVDKPFDCISLKTKSNERLEFIGDGVLELIKEPTIAPRIIAIKICQCSCLK